MIEDLELTTESAMLRSWASAELSHPERWKGLTSLVHPTPLRRFQRGELLHEYDLQALEAAIRMFRAPLLRSLLPIAREWYTCALPMRELENLKVTVGFPPFAQAAPSGLFGELASVPTTERPIPADAISRLRSGFDLTAMKGCPIVVAESTQGPYLLVEGYTRCCVALLKHREGEFDEGRMPLFLGIVSGLAEWEWAKAPTT